MREPKPSWADVPEGLREKLATLIGEPIADAQIAWGGYSPSATFVLTMASGRRVFCKGTHPGQTELGHKALLSERRKYERLPELARFGPAYLGGIDHESWHMAVLDYVPRGRSVPPWTADTAEQALHLIADFHAATPEHAASTLRPFTETLPAKHVQSWRSLREDAVARDRFLALFESPSTAERWFERHIDRIVALEREAATIGGPQGWLHMDTRSDNLVFAADGRVVLVDWPVLAVGPVLFDLAAFLPSLEGEGGPHCADALAFYERRVGHIFDPIDVARAVADVSGYFAARAGEPAISALPRLRWIQRLQLSPALRWLAQCAALEAPPVPRPLEA
jgi:hypothetical protein